MEIGKQSLSWSSYYGVRGYPRLVAQIFFPTNGFGLDDNDRSVLDSLISNYRLDLLNRRIKLDFVGHADYRGSIRDNERLGLRRAEAVQAYVSGSLGIMTGYFSSSTLSLGEKDAGRIYLAGDRRVDISSDYVPIRRILVPPMSVVGRVPKPQVALPIQYVDITTTYPDTAPTDHTDLGIEYHTLIIEKHGDFDVDCTVPYNNRMDDHDRPGLTMYKDVSRHRIDWRKWRKGDSVKVGVETATELLCRIAGSRCNSDLREGIPKFDLPNIVFPSWDAYIAKYGVDDNVRKYKGKRF